MVRVRNQDDLRKLAENLLDLAENAARVDNRHAGPNPVGAAAPDDNAMRERIQVDAGQFGGNEFLAGAPRGFQYRAQLRILDHQVRHSAQAGLCFGEFELQRPDSASRLGAVLPARG